MWGTTRTRPGAGRSHCWTTCPRATWERWHRKHEGGALRHLRASEADQEHARLDVLDVRAVEDRQELPEVPPCAGAGVPRLRQRSDSMTVLPSSPMRAFG